MIQLIGKERDDKFKIMNVLSLMLLNSTDTRIVWQTCNLLTLIFQSLNGSKIHYSLQNSLIRWALITSETNGDFISCCLTARQQHSEVNSVIINLLCEIANIGKFRKKNEISFFKLFAELIPRYFSSELDYLNLMQDVLDTHFFTIEKER